MIQWKIGEVNLIGYPLQIKCIKDALELLNGAQEQFYQLVLFKKGTAVLHVNGKSIAINAPSVFCISDRDSIELRSPKNEYEMDLIAFQPCVINHLFNCDNVADGGFDSIWTTSVNQDRFLLIPFFERKVPYGGIMKLEVNAMHRMLQLFEKIKSQLEQEPDNFWPCRSRSFLIELLIMQQMRYVDDTTSKEFLELDEAQEEIDGILDFIHSHYSDKITIDLITRQFHMNRNSLNQRFSKLTGSTPISYLIEHRLKVAESLLINTQIPVYEICERVGFSELSNFMRSFKKKYGQTPAGYRALYTTMEAS